MINKFTENLENVMDNLYLEGAFFTAGDKNKANTMTISWGSVGYMWRKPMFMALIRTNRYTNEFLDLGETYTISVPKRGSKKEALTICGTKSGRDIDKEKEANIKFIDSKSVKTPVVEGCDRYFECKIVYKQEIDLENMDEDIVKAVYSKDAKHVLYFGEIVEEY